MANKPWKYRSTDYWENDAIGGLHFHQQISITRWRSKCYLDGSTYKVNIRKTAFTSNKPCVDFEKKSSLRGTAAKSFIVPTKMSRRFQWPSRFFFIYII